MNRAEVYGDLFFETIAIRNGEVQLFDLHLKRIKRGCEILQFNSDTIERKVIDLIASKISGVVNGRLRLVISRSGDGFYLSNSNEANLEVQLFDLPATKYSIQSIGLYTENVKSLHPLSSIKSNGSIISVLASMYAKENKFDDAFIINSSQRICESISSNVFWINEEGIFTPPISEGCVAGVMREHLIHILNSNKIKVIEQPLTEELIKDADEVFLTNSIHQIVSINTYSDKKYSSNKTDALKNLLST